ncbi:unnamed protein product [Caenorhabditis auriculariae]|uniref:Transmembrane protein 144 n=1 Tax=Caenorhabditis auriculariae TaxID=2777116 RepID=A0A8S1H6L9_9PELO|nr:unnamed protein product [Caenorhabditis auriculariae]
MFLGICICLCAAFCLGSVFVPLKKFPPSDGFTTQLFMAIGAFAVACVTSVLINFPPVYPVALLGGVVWSSGNALAVPILSRLGMALGILIWNSVACVVGWATARFGLFGVPQMLPDSHILNYMGIVVLVVGSVFYLFVKSNVVEDETGESNVDAKDAEEPAVPATERLIAIGGAMLSGFFYGSMCTPITMLQTRKDLYPGMPSQGLPYHFSFFTGVMFTSGLIFAGYCVFKRNQPYMSWNLALPAMCSGAIFSSAMGFLFVANGLLSQTIAFPICMMAPGIVAAAWSVLYFREISGRRNLIFLGVASTFTFVGVTMVTVSKDTSH